MEKVLCCRSNIDGVPVLFVDDVGTEEASQLLGIVRAIVQEKAKGEDERTRIAFVGIAPGAGICRVVSALCAVPNTYVTVISNQQVQDGQPGISRAAARENSESTNSLRKMLGLNARLLTAAQAASCTALIRPGEFRGADCIVAFADQDVSMAVFKAVNPAVSKVFPMKDEDGIFVEERDHDIPAEYRGLDLEQLIRRVDGFTDTAKTRLINCLDGVDCLSVSAVAGQPMEFFRDGGLRFGRTLENLLTAAMALINRQVGDALEC